MNTRDFPWLRAMVRESILGRLVQRLVTTSRSALTDAAVMRRLHRAQTWRQQLPADARWRLIGVMAIAAGITHVVLTRWQAPHQAPIAAPVIGVLLISAGLITTSAGSALNAAWKSSVTRRAWNSLIR